VAALVAGALAAVGCSPFSQRACACAPALAPMLGYVTTINGQSGARPRGGPVPSLHVRPGEDLVMRVAVAVPRHLQVTALWLGISTGTWGGDAKGRPTGMNPILAHSRQSLSAGVHTFGLRWRVPEGRSGISLYLVCAYSTEQPPMGLGAGAIAALAVN
jgi:hypothetical protein